MAAQFIELEGIRVHNLKIPNLRIRRNTLTVVCGVSGSGKSSLAFDTLFAEGQRRYVETFSPYARQFLDRVERPAVDRIGGLPPAIAIRQNVRPQNAHSTVGTRTEVLDYLRVLFSKAGTVLCPDCRIPAVAFTPDSAARYLFENWHERRAMLVFELTTDRSSLEHARQSGYSRCIFNGQTGSIEDLVAAEQASKGSLFVVADRIQITGDSLARIAESIEQTFVAAGKRCFALVEEENDDSANATRRESIDGRSWRRVLISRRLVCTGCDQEFVQPSPELLNFQSPVGACPNCEGTGQVSSMTFDKVVPDQSLSLKAGAIQPWNTPAYRHELDELLELADEFEIPTDIPFADLDDEKRRLIYSGVPEHDFGGLTGFHQWLVRNRYKTGVSVFLNRWRSWLTCDSCHGTRLTSATGRIVLDGLTLTELLQQEISDVQTQLQEAIDRLPDHLTITLAAPIQQLCNRLNYLNDSGLGYLSLDRSMKTLSGGEAQRVVLTSALGSGLVNTLYVLDEPTSGLHADDTERVILAARQLQQRGNSVVVVEHDPDFIRAADDIIEIGPGAGNEGGKVVFQGVPAQIVNESESPTGKSLERIASDAAEPSAQRSPSAWIDFENVNCHNINDLSGRIPLHVVCAVTGVSGSGKSSLIVDALYPAVCRALGQTCSIESTGTIESVSGIELISAVCLLDQNPLPRYRRSVPATVIGCFDDIRRLMAETHESKKRNYKPGMFSFNSARGGRCPSCDGIGVVTVEMQFLADIETTCEACSGRRFRPDVLEVRYRDRSIHEILEMTVEQAFLFFNGHRKLQQRLNALRQAGLGYIRLGQPVSTLSGGESQRLRIGALLAGVPLDGDSVPIANRRSGPREAARGTLFILDEPSTGLHMQDVDSLMKCLNHLVEIGHSVIVIEHDRQVVNQADWEVQLGPGPGRLGGRIVSEE